MDAENLVVRAVRPALRDPAEQRHLLLELLQRIPEMDGSFLDSHEFGRSYGTAAALLTLHNAMARD
jgi:hypothetical protein